MQKLVPLKATQLLIQLGSANGNVGPKGQGLTVQKLLVDLGVSCIAQGCLSDV